MDLRKKRKDELALLHERAELAGGRERQEKKRSKGSFLARERVSLLLDEGSFVELDKFASQDSLSDSLKGVSSEIVGDGVIAGYGQIQGKLVFVFSQDFTVFGGSLSARNAEKICKVMDLALENHAPIIGLCDSGGARIQEGVESLAGYADIFLRNTLLSGAVPQISAILGPCAGGAVYSPAITDFIFMTDKTSHMFITGPDVIKAVTKEQVSKEDLGGGRTHFERSGVCSFLCKDEKQVISEIRRLVSFIPANYRSRPSYSTPSDPIDRDISGLEALIPSNPAKPYNMADIVKEILDEGSFIEVSGGFAKNIIVAFGSLGGQKVGLVANNPKYLAGCLDIDASVKAARFVRFCDCFNIPLLTLVDVPGFLPGSAQEFGGIIRHGAKLLYAYAEATVPKVTLIVRKGYGGAYDVMCSKHLRADLNFALPIAEVAVMGPEGAVNIIHRKELEGLSGAKRKKLEKSLAEDYREKFANPWDVARLGFVDAVIEIKDIRSEIYRSLVMLRNKKQSIPEKKHGNIPL